MAWTRYLACFSPRRDISYPQIRAKLGPWHLIGREGSGYVKCYIFRYSRTHISLFILHKCQVIDAWHNWFSWTVESTRLITAEPSIHQHTCLKRNKTHRYHSSQKMYSEHKRTKHQRPKFSARTKFSLLFPEAINFLFSYRFRSLVFTRRLVTRVESCGRPNCPVDWFTGLAMDREPGRIR